MVRFVIAFHLQGYNCSFLDTPTITQEEKSQLISAGAGNLTAQEKLGSAMVWLVCVVHLFCRNGVSISDILALLLALHKVSWLCICSMRAMDIFGNDMSHNNAYLVANLDRYSC